MAIKMVTGVPGCGKTYYVVNYLLEKYCSYDSRLDEYKPICTIITNVKDLKLPHLDLETVLSSSGKSVDAFFCVPYQELVQKKYNKIVYVIDEAQNLFPYGEKKKDVEYLFQYHRHLGLDFLLVTQDKRTLNRNIQALIEIEVHAVPRSIGLPGVFHYTLRVGDIVVARKTLKKSQKVFNLYTSFEIEGEDRPKNSMRFQFIAIGLAGLIALSFGYYRYKSRWSGGSVAVAAEIPKKEANLIQVNNQKIASPKVVVHDKPKKRSEKIKEYKYLASHYKINNEIYVIDENGLAVTPLGDSRFLVSRNRIGLTRVLTNLPPQTDIDSQMSARSFSTARALPSSSLPSRPIE